MLFLFAALLVVQPGQIHVVAAGDSHTQAYWRLMEEKLAGHGIDADVSVVARGGIRIDHFVGQTPHVGEVLDFPGDVLALQPDVILFMIGTNDAVFDSSNPGYFDSTYLPLHGQVVSQFQNAALTITATIPPIIREDLQPAEQLIQSTFNPYLRQAAAAAGTPWVDVHELISTQPNFEDLYNDGVHLWGQMVNDEWTMEGYHLVAEAFATTIRAQLQGTLPGDANNDWTVTGLDLLAVQQAFGGGGSADGLLLGDGNDDGLVTGLDLIAVQENFGVANPEPSSAALVVALSALASIRGPGRPRTESSELQSLE